MYKQFGSHAELYLERFPLFGEILYGLEFLSLTVHSLPHVVGDTVNMDCPVTDIDAFSFENGMRFIKKHVSSGYKPLAQLCTKVERDLEINNEDVCIPPELQLLKSTEVDGVIHVKNLSYKSFKLSAKAPNNFVFMKDGSLIRIKDFICFSLNASPSQIVILGAEHKLLGSGYEFPTKSSHLGIYRVDGDDAPKTIQLSLIDVKTTFVFSPIFEQSTDVEEFFAVPMLH
ncbi:hypothetical protein QAD02_021778 [Eretmocerus hayati]|uniref:Uncharacterized protein n=1 Tax=Eretmocerus hayati TaxID=131215 RepID=A0ACC2PRF3_9HYME|nr:hypothetical protein QAD02_021778 [Eretmocerus hayati]